MQILFLFFSLFYLMVLTSSHTISKSKTDEEKFDETIDNLRDSAYSTEYIVDKHDRFHRKPRRQEMARATKQKEEEEKTLAMAKTRNAAKDSKKSYFTDEKFLNLFQRKKYKTSTKCSSKRKKKDRKMMKRSVVPVENSNVTTKSRRNRRKRKRNFTLQMHKRHVTPYLFSTTNDLPKSSKEFHYQSGLSHRFDFPTKDFKLAYEFPFVTESPSAAVISTESTQEFIGTAEIENMLAQIKERAIYTIANEPPYISELITTTVTETTFEADPILQSFFPRSSTLKNVFSYYMKQKRSLTSTTAGLENQNDSSFKGNVVTSACCFEAQLRKEINELLQIVKRKLCLGVKCVKCTTKHLLHDAKEDIQKATEPMMRLDVSFATENKPIMRNTRNSTTTKRRLFRHHETTTSMADQLTLNDDDDYSMLKRFEYVLSKAHENNAIKMVTTPNNVLSYKRNVNKVSKRNQETIEDLNLKENIRKLVDSYPIPDEVDYNKDTSIGVFRKGDYDTKTEGSSSGSNLEGLSKRLSYKEYVDGFKNYLNYVRETTSSNFSNLVRYQAHRHHKVDDIGKFILDKIPSTVPQIRKKRRFFDDSDGDDQDMSTKSDESWFKRHFYLFIDTGPPKKYTHTVSSKHARETIEHKRGKKTPTTAVSEITTEDTKNMPGGDISEILKFLDYTIQSLAALKMHSNGRLYFFFIRCNKEVR